MAIKKIKQLMEDLENDTHVAMASNVAKATAATLASSASYAGTSLKATSAGYAGTSFMARTGTSGTSILA